MYFLYLFCHDSHTKLFFNYTILSRYSKNYHFTLFYFQNFYNSIRFYFIPFVIISICCCIWGLQMLMRMIAPYFPYYKIMQKYLVVQLVLLMCKIQPTIADLVVTNVNFPCNYPLTPHVYKNGKILLIAVLVYLKS